MIAHTSRLLRLSLIVGLASAVASAPAFAPIASAQEDEDEDEDEGEDEDGGDDGGDEGGDEGEEEEEDEEEGEEEGQPPVTAGGLFTKKTYPLGELQRPLTITEGMTELRAGVGADLSAKTAFTNFGFLVDGRYGLADNAELQAGFKGIYNFHQIEAYLGFEGSLVYDLVDFRIAGRFYTCENADNESGEPRQPPFLCEDGEKDDPMKPETLGLQGPFPLQLDVGFPIRYAPKPQVAVVALETLFSIDFDSVPDLSPSIGVIVQPLPIVSVLVKARVDIRDFDTEADNFTVPATAAVQLALSNTLDLGLEFTLENVKASKKTPPVKPTDEFGPFDRRFLVLYGQLRL